MAKAIGRKAFWAHPFDCRMQRHMAAREPYSSNPSAAPVSSRRWGYARAVVLAGMCTVGARAAAQSSEPSSPDAGTPAAESGQAAEPTSEPEAPQSSEA